MRLPEPGRPDEQQIPAFFAIIAEVPGKRAAGREHMLHIPELLRRLAVITEVERLKALRPYQLSDARALVSREDQLALEWTKKELQNPSLLRTFGASKPARPGEFGLEMAAHASQGLWLSSMDEMEVEILYLPESELQIRGRHNAMNALAALALTGAVGVSQQAAIGTLRTYKGEPHRVELVCTVKGRDFIDDSKGTNVGAVAAAVAGLAALKLQLG